MKTTEQPDILQLLFGGIALCNLVVAANGTREMFNGQFVPFLFIFFSNAILFVIYKWKHNPNSQFSNLVFYGAWAASFIYSILTSFVGIGNLFGFDSRHENGGLFLFGGIGTIITVGSVIIISRLVFFENNATISIDASTVTAEVSPTEETTVTV